MLPIGLVDDERQMAERPQPVGGFAGRAIGDAGFAQMPVGGGETPLDIGRRKCGKGVEEPAPDRAGRAVLRRYIRREFRAAAHSRASIAPSGAGPDGPCFPDCRLAPAIPTLRFRRRSRLVQERRPQVERQGKFNCAFLGRRIDLARGVAVVLKPGQPPRFRLIGIDRLGVVAAAAGMGDVIDAAAERAAVPGIDQVKCQRRVDRNGRMQPGRRLPGLETDAGDRPRRSGRLPSSASACRCR